MLSSCGGSGAAQPVIAAIQQEIILNSGVAVELGNFDPAPTIDDGGVVWMSYSHVSKDASGITLVETRLATSADKGSSWQDVGLNINSATVSTINLGANTIATQHEVSRLVYNPFAIGAGADPWILLYHRYLGLLNGVDTERLFEHGWIGMKSGATAMTLANERKLFTGIGYDTVNNADSLGLPEVALDTLDSSLASCAVFTEPGVLPKSNGIYVALLCGVANSPGKIILLRCDHDMAGCAYKGVMIDGSEATKVSSSYDNFSAAELVTVKGEDYLIVTPSVLTLYRGCLIYKIKDLEQAQIERVGGIAQATAVIEENGDFNGACGYVEGLTGGGVLMSQAFFNSTPNFKIFTTDYNF